MSDLQSQGRRQKTKEEYSRNVKKLKIKLDTVQSEIVSLQRRVESLSNTSSDKLISMKITKFCKERRFTPEMLFRFADRTGSRSISKIDFKNTLTQLGLKLSKDEFLRLLYLIDEDLSGEISYSEYVGYLEAFAIRKEFSPNDQLAKDALQKLDLGEVLKIAEENKENINKRPNKNANLLNYQQFIKYCHKHFPGLTNKELASIFTRLEKNQLINLKDLIEYLEGLQAQRKRLQEAKNKIPIKRQDRQEPRVRPVIGGERTLKAIIKSLIQFRSKQSTIVFHSLEFLRLQRLLGAKRGQLLRMFQEIDQKRKGSFRGSFTYNQLINYFIQKSEKSPDLPFAFQLMAGKLALLKQSPVAVVGQYAMRVPDFLSEVELKKFFQDQFEVAYHQFTVISQLVPQQLNGRYAVQNLASLLGKKDGKRSVTIKPHSFPGRLIFRSARMALKCCLELEDKLAQLKQARWDDYQFGPTASDQFGTQSINLPMPSDQIDWLPTDQIGMAEFYRENIDATYTSSPICPNQVFTKTLYLLANTVPDSVWSGQKIDSMVRDIQQGHLNQLFTGMYPLAFHHFSRYGIFVVRLFIKEQWKYVIIDNKIPCAADKTPFFSSVIGHRFSFMAIIEKAYAKALGNYHAVYASANPYQYLIDLGNMLPLQYTLQKTMPQTQKNLIWQSMLKFYNQEAKKVLEGKAKKPKSMFAVMRNRIMEESKEIALHTPLKIEQVVELSDNKCRNTHKSHRLLVIRNAVPIKEEANWNKSWNREEGGNKYGQLSLQVGQKLRQPQLLKNKNIMLINYKLFRTLFLLSHPQKVNFAQMIILRKELQFEEKYKCRYQIAAVSELQFVVVLAQKSAIQDVRIVFEGKNSKQQALWKESRREEVAVRTIRIEKGGSMVLELSAQNWKAGVEYRYNLTFYMRHPRYQLKQRDRHMLFRYVSPYEEQPKMTFSDYEGSERYFIYRNFYRAAERRGCCG